MWYAATRGVITTPRGRSQPSAAGSGPVTAGSGVLWVMGWRVVGVSIFGGAPAILAVLLGLGNGPSVWYLQNIAHGVLQTFAPHELAAGAALGGLRSARRS